jgi:hypothetical protein
MSKTVKSEKELNKIVRLLSSNQNVIREAYEVGTGEELTGDILEEIYVSNVEKTIYNDITTYFLAIQFYTHGNFISIDDASIDINKKIIQ